MKESFELGTTVPLDEPCAQLGSDTRILIIVTAMQKSLLSLI